MRVTVGSVPINPDQRQAFIDELEIASVEQLLTKQDVLQSGVNVKTVNGQSLLGSGNIEIDSVDGGTF